MTQKKYIEELQLENQQLQKKIHFYEDIFKAITKALSPLLKENSEAGNETPYSLRGATPAFAAKREDSSEKNLGKAMVNAEITFLKKSLHENHWNVCRSAKAMGIPRESLYYRIKKYGLVREKTE